MTTLNRHDLQVLKELQEKYGEYLSDRMEIMMQFERVINKLEKEVGEQELTEFKKNADNHIQGSLFT